MSAWWPAGHIIGNEPGFSHQVVDRGTAIQTGSPAEPTFADGLQVQRALDAIERSAGAGSAWTPVG
jgi:hypothetical protein